jgi:hypothetical protein
MTRKTCGSKMRLWFLRPGFKSFAYLSCELVAVVREDGQQPNKANGRFIVTNSQKAK